MTKNEQQARIIIETLRQNGFTAYLAGGCVRDRLLGVEAKDFDVATSAQAHQVRALFAHTVPIGAQFGVMLVLAGDVSNEVATFRADGLYLDGRHPKNVRFSDAREDALRRDFTINGMFFDPATENVIDYVGGEHDLARQVIRAIGDPQARFAEDRLRMIRAIRFAGRLDFAIDPQTFAAIRELAPTITDIAWERIGDEVVKILTQGGAQRAFQLMSESGLLQVVLPEIEALNRVGQLPDIESEGDVFAHTLLLLAELDKRVAQDGPSETLALGTLLHDVADPKCHGHWEQETGHPIAMCRRLKRSRAVWERVTYLLKNHLRLMSAPDMRTAELKRFLREDGIEELLELARINASASRGDMRPYEFCRHKLDELQPTQICPPPLLNGRVLIQLGFEPGPRFKVILDAVEDAQLEGELATPADAVAWVKQQWGEKR